MIKRILTLLMAIPVIPLLVLGMLLGVLAFMLQYCVTQPVVRLSTRILATGGVWLSRISNATPWRRESERNERDAGISPRRCCDDTTHDKSDACLELRKRIIPASEIPGAAIYLTCGCNVIPSPSVPDSWFVFLYCAVHQLIADDTDTPPPFPQHESGHGYIISAEMFEGGSE